MERFNRFRRRSTLVLAVAAAWLGAPGAWAAPIPASDTYLSFTLSAQPGVGRIAFDGGTSPLVGQALDVLVFKGVSTPSNTNEMTLIEDGTLSFTSGAFLAGESGGREWLFAPGGSVTIRGGVPLLGLPAGTTLLSGSFDDVVRVNGLGDRGLKVQAGAFFNSVHPALAAHLGLPTDGTPYYGALATLFAADGDSPSAFSSNGYTSGEVTTAPVPEPSTALVFLTAAAGGLAWRRRPSR